MFVIIQDFSTNDIRTRRDIVRAAVRLMQPLKELLSPGKAILPLGDECAAHNGRSADMEGF